MPSLLEIRSDQNHWVGGYGPLLILFWIKEVEPKVCRQLQTLVREYSARQPDQRVSVLSISLPGSQAPSTEARKALAELIRETGSNISRVAIVREGHGFMASAVASIVVGIQMLAKPVAPHKPFNNTADAVSWVTAELSDFLTGRAQVTEAQNVVSQAQRMVPTAAKS